MEGRPRGGRFAHSLLASVLLLAAHPARAQTRSSTRSSTPSASATTTPLPYCFDVGNPASPNFERYLYGASGRYNGTIIAEGPGANYWRSIFNFEPTFNCYPNENFVGEVPLSPQY